ncbi:PAB-dependent poly(A)-specificribonuclease subunit 2 [Monoraphidium neglectum]|uniref:PAB-dependent poly(A)-specificribonuclease subunit 2 n=1 Tax=Monoraphidium neglectum TaxID=145388 RepID=A0A0D2K6N2_9CHLO|nr:PAB-dependent poly(A)-specificribonuclease subunit 2 [Monoraphidium neglectum]KIY91848.1 PAB-dependent poly(A)-specificribonuclease subunit 2 [Monoraphidium neglectum]|eukprot:XP_013890868.1 PAB-dependent poly(A)-specificribonuclease subunit 2 [Monoraphidium neglectum]
MVYTTQAATLEPYAFWKAHPGCVHALLPLGEAAALSLSSDALALHTAGGVPRMRMERRPRKGAADAAAAAAAAAAPEEDWLCCALEPGQGQSRVLVGGSGGGVTTVDLVGSKRAGQADVAKEGVVAIKAPPGRGLLVMGTEGGRVLLGDARRGVKVDHTALAHPGGLACLDARADMVVTCGYGVRMGQTVPDNTVRVFDLRYSLRPLFALTAPAPVAVAWHPQLPMGVVVASADGSFCVADVSNPAAAHNYQVADLASVAPAPRSFVSMHAWGPAAQRAPFVSSLVRRGSGPGLAAAS